MRFFYIFDHRLLQINAVIRRGELIDPENNLSIISPAALSDLSSGQKRELQKIIDNAKLSGAREVALGKAMAAELQNTDEQEKSRIKSEYKKRFSDLREETAIAIDLYKNHPRLKKYFLHYNSKTAGFEKLLDSNAAYSEKDCAELAKYIGGFMRNWDVTLLNDVAEVNPEICRHKETQEFCSNLAIYYFQQNDIKSFRALLKGPLAVAFYHGVTKDFLLTVISRNIDNKEDPWLSALVSLIPSEKLHEDLAVRCHNRELFTFAVQNRYELLLHLLDPHGNLINGRSGKIVSKAPQVELPRFKLNYIEVPGRFAQRQKPVYDYHTYTPSTLRKSEQSVHPQFSPQILADIHRIVEFGLMLEAADRTYPVPYNALPLLFETTDEALGFLRASLTSNPNSSQPLHDSFLFSLPREHNWQAKSWGKLVLKFGEDALNALPLAPEIEKKIEYENKELEKEGRQFRYVLEKLSIEQLTGFAEDIFYSNQSADTDLAEICFALMPKISQTGFDHGVAARQNISEADNIPDIGIIDGEELGFPGFYMIKLRKDDPRILVTGRYVDCCNHLDGETSAMAIAAVTEADGGCYALFKRSSENSGLQQDIMVGKTIVYRAKVKETPEGEKYSNLVFNSWERLPLTEIISASTGSKMLGEVFLQAAAQKAIEVAEARNMEPVKKVNLGRNRDNFGSFPPTDREEARTPATASYDSVTQFNIINLEKVQNVEPKHSEKPNSFAHNSTPSSLRSSTNPASHSMGRRYS